MSTVKTLATRRVAWTLAAACLAVGLVAPAAPAQNKITLRWKFQPGQTIGYTMETTTVGTGLDPSGREMKRTTALTLDMTWTVKSVDPSGIASWTQTIDRVRISVESPGSKVSADSKEAADGAGLFGPLFKILAGAEFTSKMNSRGELVEIKLAEKLLATLAESDNGGGPKGQFSEEGLKNLLQQMVVPLPEGAVAPGETWQRKLNIPTEVEGQNRAIEQIFTYVGPEAGTPGLEQLDFTTKMEPRKPNPQVPIVYKKETTTGRFDFDNTAGRIAKSNSLETVEVAITVQGKEIPQKLESTRILTLTPKAP